MEMIKAVIFDMDGVIIDSHPNINKLFTKVANQKLKINILEKEFAKYPGMRFEDRIKKILSQKGIKIIDEKIMDAVDYGRKIYFSGSFIKEIPLFEGIRELLETLKTSGTKIALGTNGSIRTVARVLEINKLKKYFSAIVTFDDVEHGKPAPDIFLKAAENLKLKPEECIVIDDAIEGIIAAHSAGMKIIAVASTQKKEQLREADIIVDTIKDINLEKIRAMG